MNAGHKKKKKYCGTSTFWIIRSTVFVIIWRHARFIGYDSVCPTLQIIRCGYQHVSTLTCISEIKLIFEMLTVCGQQHWFSTHERMFLWKCRRFRDRKCLDLRGDSNHQPSDSCRMLQPHELSRPDICCPMYLNTGSGDIDIFEVKLIFELLTVRGQQHSFSTHGRMFLWKCRRQKRSRTPNLRIHAECSNHLSYQGQIFVVPCIWILALVIDKDILKLKLAFKMLTVCIDFRLTKGCSCESAEDLETENVSTWGGLEPPTFGFMPNVLTTWAIRARYLLSHVLECWLWRFIGYDLVCPALQIIRCGYQHVSTKLVCKYTAVLITLGQILFIKGPFNEEVKKNDEIKICQKW